MTFVVTGGGGFVGTALVRALLARGAAVRALVRDERSEARLRALGSETVRGNLGTGTAPTSLVAPGDVLVHAAARVAMHGPWSAFRRDTVDSTRELLHAAIPHRPARVVYVSSAAVYAVGAGRDGYAAGRSPERPHPCNAYGRAKLAAERVVRRACDAARVPWSVVRLGFLYGAGNRAFEAQAGPLLRRGWLPVLGRGTNAIATLHVDDAVEAILLAAARPEAVGRVYDVASPERVTQADFLAGMAAALGHAAPRRHVPAHLAFAAAGLVELVSRALRVQPPFTPAMVGLMAVDQRLDATRIGRELGWAPTRTFTPAARLRLARDAGRHG